MFVDGEKKGNTVSPSFAGIHFTIEEFKEG